MIGDFYLPFGKIPHSTSILFTRLSSSRAFCVGQCVEQRFVVVSNPRSLIWRMHRMISTAASSVDGFGETS
ncbi:hypothetical protein KCP76_24875 [Salmonella enterica subsp. enterica serovar Weltevreden]|nr:hypothetical protein KCP76_24875 [Salmonella enterica subsp. enterica serovar Weltevreden]